MTIAKTTNPQHQQGIWLTLDYVIDQVNTQFSNMSTGITDTTYGDITVSAGGTVWTLGDGTVGLSNFDNTITAAGKALLDDADAAAQRTTLGLATAALYSVNYFATAAAPNTSVAVHEALEDPHPQYLLPSEAALSTLNDVVVVSIQDTQVLAWDSATSKWKNVAQSGSSGGGAWGDITGTLSDQTDLASALSGKASTAHTHSDGTTSVAGFLSTADKTKLDGIATAATANSSDATLKARANHTGTQTASTISDFSTAADARIAVATITESQVVNLTSDLAAKLASSAVSAFGLTLVDDANAATARTTLGLATVASTGAYSDLSGKPTLGTAAAQDTTAFDASGAATTAVASHVAAGDPHTQYQKESEKGQVNGYAELGSDGKVPTAQLGGPWGMNAWGGTAIPFTWSETEIDFGSSPIYDAQFTLTDVTIASNSKILVMPSGNAATDRTADDWQWDMGMFVATPATGSATVYAQFFPGPIVGKRKIQYQIR